MSEIGQGTPAPFEGLKFAHLIGFAALAGLGACNDGGTVFDLDAQLTIDPPIVDLGPVQIGTTRTVDILLRNTGKATLNLEGVFKGVPYDEAFEYELDRTSLVPNAIAVLSVKFAPLELGEQNAKLIVRSVNSEVEEQEIELIGEGASTSLIVDPEFLSFGSVVINSTKEMTVTLTNNSDLDANIEYQNGDKVRRCSSSQADNSVYCVGLRDRQIGPDGRFSLKKGESTEMKVEFRPVIAGARESGSFFLKACEASACEIEVRLDGLSVEQGFVCDPANLDFAKVNPGSCRTMTVGCSNVANEQVTVISWDAATQGAGSTSPDFSIQPSEVRVLAEGDSMDIDVTYCPNELGDDTGTLAIETDNPRQRTVFIPLNGSGGGPDIQVLPDQLNFGLNSLISPTQRPVTIINNGVDTLEIRDARVDGSAGFSVESAAGTRLEPGEFATIAVTFEPFAEGPVQSSLVIASNDQDEPEVTVTLLGEGINLPPCSYEVRSPQMSFGVVERGRTVSRAIEIRNVGAHDCLISSVILQDPGTDPAISLPDGDIISELIPPGAAKTIRVEFAPQRSGTHEGVLEIWISDPINPKIEVRLSGTGADSTLLVVPNDIDYGTIGVGCAARARTVTIYNTSASPSTIESVVVTGNTEAFWLETAPAPLPDSALVLQPGESTELEVGFSAAIQSDFAGAVEINTIFGGAQQTYVVSLQGRGDLDAVQIDEFDQLGRPKVDILFVIDDSCSMREEQAALASNFQAFIQFAETQALDYQIAVTTTDVGDGNPAEVGRILPLDGNPADRIVTPTSQPSPAAVFAANANVGIDNSTFTEQGLQAAYLALSSPLIFGHNAGFVRQDAVLSVILVSDEPDFSPGDVDFFINFFLSIKGFRNTNLFSASAIVGDVPGGCDSPDGDADPGPRYLEAANRTGGIFQSICSRDWSRSLEELSATAFGFKSRFFLTNQPVIPSLRVLIDDVELPKTSAQGAVNWSYDFATNSINFSPFAVPEPGSNVRVEYSAECL